MYVLLQKSHTGVHGVIGLPVVRRVEEVYPSEGGIATNLIVLIPFIKIALEMAMKKRNAINSVVQVSITISLCSN